MYLLYVYVFKEKNDSAEPNLRGPNVARASVTKQRTHSELIQEGLCPGVTRFAAHMYVCVCLLALKPE